MQQVTNNLRRALSAANRRVLRGAAFPVLRTMRRQPSVAGLRRALHVVRMSRQPIVLGGCGRSGTTLLLSVLSCHGEVFAIPEETAALCPTAYHAHLKRPDLCAPLDVETLYRNLLDREVPRACTRWCEKTPANILFARRILDYFGPGARFVNIVRDGRDVVCSVHPSDPARYWVEPPRWVESLSVGRSMECEPRFTTIRYEDLVADFERTIRNLCSFLDLDFDMALLSYPQTATIKASKAWFHTAQEVHSASTERWRQPQHAERVRALMAEPGAVQLLRHYGYLSD